MGGTWSSAGPRSGGKWGDCAGDPGLTHFARMEVPVRSDGMAHPPDPNTHETAEGTARADAAVRALVLLLARQAVREVLAGAQAKEDARHAQQEPD